MSLPYSQSRNDHEHSQPNVEPFFFSKYLTLLQSPLSKFGDADDVFVIIRQGSEQKFCHC